MQLFDIIILFFTGICFGSFSSVLIERWHSGKGGIMLGRSACPKCNHTLGASELIPLFSYIIQGGRCKKCRTQIGWFYPILEFMMGSVFLISGWIGFRFGYDYTNIMWWIFLIWGFITAVYIVYDIRYTEIPDELLVPGISLTLVALFAGFISPNIQLFFDIPTYQTFHTSDNSAYYSMIRDHLSAAILLYSFFYLQILLPGFFFLIKKRRYTEILSLLLGYFLFPITLILSYFVKNQEGRREEEHEILTWIGGGDLRIALFIGLTLGTIHGVASFFFAYILGSLYGCSILIKKRGGEDHHTKVGDTQIPFGPFLGIGWFLSLIFYSDILIYITGQ